jgi:hypothetical protein
MILKFVRHVLASRPVSEDLILCYDCPTGKYGLVQFLRIAIHAFLVDTNTIESSQIGIFSQICFFLKVSASAFKLFTLILRWIWFIFYPNLLARILFIFALTLLYWRLLS